MRNPLHSTLDSVLGSVLGSILLSLALGLLLLSILGSLKPIQLRVAETQPGIFQHRYPLSRAALTAK